MAAIAKQEWIGIIQEVRGQGCPAHPPSKVFKPKHGLPKLEDYKGAAPPGYWSIFPTNYEHVRPSLICPKKLRRLAKEYGVQGAMLDQVLIDLEEGADIGCRGLAREPTFSTNAPSAYQFGAQVSDAIADWVAKGVAFGPVERKDLPADAKINGIMCKEKPNGSVRIINNLSMPKGQSVNDGINKYEFPAIMSSTTKFVGAVNRSGPGSYMTKLDWESAYKHISVRQKDRNLQWFQWMDRFFMEQALVFGGISSVGIYDRHAKIVLELVLAATGFPREQVCQHLDHVPAVGRLDELMAFDDTYYAIAGELGVRLTPRDDPEKAFGPSQTGVVLGVHYDTKNWTWAVPKERLTRLLIAIHEAMLLRSIPAADMESVVGKIINVKPLVPGGRFHVDQLLLAVSKIRRDEKAKRPAGPIRMTPLLFSQLEYWSLLLPACSGRTRIPDLEAGPPAWSVDFFTDAAGGSLRDPSRGLGGVGPGFWFYASWPRCINAGQQDERGRSLARKLSLLELMGPLFVVAVGHKQCKGQDVRVWVDNAGAVHIYRKGYSTACPRTSTVARAIAVVAAGLGCRLYVCKIRRCSTPGAVMADAISKGELRKFAGLWDGPLPEGAMVPRCLLRWLQNPVADPGLGDRILGEIL